VGDIDYQALEFTYRPQPAQAENRHPIVIVGAGPVGLSMALDLAQRGSKVVVIDDDYRLSTGSRAICFAKRTLDIWDRLGVGQNMADKGVSWNVGKVFFKGEEVWRFDLLPEPGHRRPAFINLQQYYCEGFLYEHAAQHTNGRSSRTTGTRGTPPGVTPSPNFFAYGIFSSPTTTRSARASRAPSAGSGPPTRSGGRSR